jgi:sporulation protein YlmC with PRC-barrel domain
MKVGGLTGPVVLSGMSGKDNVVPMPDEERFDHELDGELPAELVVSGAIHPVQTGDRVMDVRRGMLILTSEGREAGRVAAVIIDRHDQLVTHILLSRLDQMPEYRLVPIALVEQVIEEQVRLGIHNQIVNTLPLWHGS